MLTWLLTTKTPASILPIRLVKVARFPAGVPAATTVVNID